MARSDTSSPHGPDASSDRRIDVQLFLIAILAAAPIWLAAALRPDAFYVGDSGVKLIAARAAVAHPGHPLQIALPEIGGVGVPHVEPFFGVHGDHAHAVTSPLFPLLSAPALALFGLRGLYLLPYLSFLVVAAACAALVRPLRLSCRPATAALVSMLGTPFLFYGLEFWEHLPAVACAATSLALLLRGKGLASGLFAGIAILLRPEALCLLAASAAAAPYLTPSLTRKTLASALLGAAAILLPYELYVWQHFGTLVPPHIGVNAAATATQGWLPSRAEILALWFAGIDKSSFWGTSPAAIAAIGAVVALRRSSTTKVLATLGLAAVLLTVLTVPNDGGGQWSPRYLLFAQIPLVLVAANGFALLPRGATRTALATLSVLVCVWLQRDAYRDLRGTKALFGQVVDAVATATPDPRPIVTDIWWLDQVAAAAVGDRPALFAPDERTALDIVQRLSRATVPAVTLVRSGAADEAPSAWLDGSCYFEEGRLGSPGREIVAIQLRHRCRQ